MDARHKAGHDGGTIEGSQLESALEFAAASPGIYNAPVCLAVYAKVFEEESALDKLEAFASLNGAAHYGLKPMR